MLLMLDPPDSRKPCSSIMIGIADLYGSDEHIPRLDPRICLLQPLFSRLRQVTNLKRHRVPSYFHRAALPVVEDLLRQNGSEAD